ncbi:glucosidase [Ruficoccus amylovorans]|uniref:Glucosidase n=1 Tax=Ruficoccus amylovorans TaxID=1804625 RepID=A0A842HCD7_9BACT|nr:glucosidase [Ruficoccus amylovorans]MBC2593267.1 glucosidase [Ruficoccus amylovorans]
MPNNPERQRLDEAHDREKNWKRWGPYLSERQWGTVREDYSADGEAWDYFTHDQARSRAYRWGEDGLLGITDRECRLCFALALWNEKDPILKERLFGLTGKEGNHGEDCKELYYYLDSSPTHSYFKSLYKYPQAAYPYEHLLAENARRGRNQPEFELLDTGVFESDRYFDVFAEYAKAAPNDLLIKITVVNRGPDAAPLHLLPTLWFRNTWSWGCSHEGCTPKPRIAQSGPRCAEAHHDELESFILETEEEPADWLFTENESNNEKLFGSSNASPFTKDAFHHLLCAGETDAVNPDAHGTKAAPHFRLTLKAGETRTLRLRLSLKDKRPPKPFGPEFERAFKTRIRETDEYYRAIIGEDGLHPHEEQVIRQAYAGLLHSKQFYHYVVKDWLDGDPGEPPPPESRQHGRNAEWTNIFCRDVISMPDKWEYPWFAAWDLAFHMIPFDKIDPDFAKKQLILMLREWYMHPNGQIPAYEWNFSDVNPPVHAWAVWRVYKMTGRRGARDLDFLAQCFHKLLINFTWWVNRKDPHGKNLFAGGFLGLDNIGAFDRSKPLPDGYHLEQADGTAWMAFFCSTMLSISLELAANDPAYEGVASKFFEHFVAIAEAMNTLGGTGLWNEQDGFYYDMLQADGTTIPMAIRSMVGLLPICAAEVLQVNTIEKLPRFKKRLQWFLTHNEVFSKEMSCLEFEGGRHEDPKLMLAIPSRPRLERVLRYLFDENEFLSPYGLRSLSKVHRDNPFRLNYHEKDFSVSYQPAESDSALFGGNSNWRGPIWFPVNYLLIEALEKYHHYYGDDLKVELPTGSGNWVNLQQAAAELSRRLCAIFLPDKHGDRPVHRLHAGQYRDKHFRDLVLFNEYFDGDNGRGVGASHQTGWTGLVAKLLEDKCRHKRADAQPQP